MWLCLVDSLMAPGARAQGWIKWRGQTWHACRFVPRDSPESADMCLSAGQRIAISGLGSWEIALGVVLPRRNLSQRGFRLSDSAIWIVRLWVWSAWPVAGSV